MVKQLFHHRGLFIIITVCIVTLWLYFANKLVLFIHPRYFLFTAIFAAVGLLFSVAALLFIRKDPEEDHQDNEFSYVKKIGYLILTAGVISLFTLFTPTSLSTQNVNLARVNNFTFGTNETVNIDSNSLSVKNWSTVLSGNLPFDENKEVKLTGFIVPIDEDNFFLTRYVLSCCAIDAQPVAVPVNAPDWNKSLKEGDWVSVEGLFKTSTVNNYSHVLKPSTLKNIKEPKEPYDY
jgi:putative membrane protein